MRFMILVKATPESERGEMPTPELLREMMAFNEALVASGILLAGEGLQPSREGMRIRFDADGKHVIDGPFAETKELVAGFWLIEVKSREEAVEWLRRVPNPMPGSAVAEIELRKVVSMEDFAEVVEQVPDVVELEARLRAESEARRSR